MGDILAFLQLPFVQRAVFAGLMLAVIAGVMGVIILIRRVSFYGEAIAHSSLAGVAIGLWLGWYPLAVVMVYAVLLALTLPWLRRAFRLHLDNLLAILLPSSMGFGVLIFSMLPGYQPEMMSFLFGSMITIRMLDLFLLVVLFSVSVILFALFLPRMIFSSLDEEYAALLKVKSIWLERLYEVLLALVIIAGVKLLGVVLINALLIIPASAAKLISGSLYGWVWTSVGVSVFIVVGGLLLSLGFNAPPGSAIAVFAGVVFVVVAGVSKVRLK